MTFLLISDEGAQDSTLLKSKQNVNCYIKSLTHPVILLLLITQHWLCLSIFCKQNYFYWWTLTHFKPNIQHIGQKNWAIEICQLPRWWNFSIQVLGFHTLTLPILFSCICENFGTVFTESWSLWARVVVFGVVSSENSFNAQISELSTTSNLDKWAR